MRKSSVNTKKLSNQGCQKISSFFKKIPKKSAEIEEAIIPNKTNPSNFENPNEIVYYISDDDVEDDDTPDINKKKLSRRNDCNGILKVITNSPKSQHLHKKSNKRKQPSLESCTKIKTNLDNQEENDRFKRLRRLSVDILPESDVTKSSGNSEFEGNSSDTESVIIIEDSSDENVHCKKTSNGSASTKNYKNINSDVAFLNYHSRCDEKHSNCDKSSSVDETPSCNKSASNLDDLPSECYESKCNKTPPKQNRSALSSNQTPSSCDEMSSGNKGTPSNGNKRSATTLNGKKTPTKLFEGSPKTASGFKVQTIDDFLRLTPSKSNEKNLKKKFSVTPDKSAQKQSSILDFASLSGSKTPSDAQSKNEMTPKKSSGRKSSPCCSPKAAKVKQRLNFQEDREEKESAVAADEIKVETKDENTWGSLALNETFEFNFDEEWDQALPVDNFPMNFSTFKHCKVLEVSRKVESVTLQVESSDLKSKEKGRCQLEGFWVYMRIEPGSSVHIQARKCKNENIWKITNDYGFIVYEPDLLLSSTSIVGSIFCKRKTVLSEFFHGFESANSHMLIGTLVHMLFQTALKKNIRTSEPLLECLDNFLKRYDTVRKIYESSLTSNEIKKQIKAFIPRICSFMERYVETDDMCAKGKYITVNKDNWKGKIDSIQDIEENIWCPNLGTKGKIDVSVATNHKMLPLELKTGRATMSLEHKGQVMLYIMMMQNYGYKVDSGLLLYLREGVLKEIFVTEREKRDLMMLRNELAFFLTKKSQVVSDHEEIELPDPISHHSACEKCSYNMICCAYLERQNTNLSGNRLEELKARLLKHLKEEHLNYFICWTNLLKMENSLNYGKSSKDIYTVSPSEREKKGKCISNVKIVDSVTLKEESYHHTFEKNEACANFLASDISDNSYIVVSTEKRPAISIGVVVFIDADRIIVALDCDLSKKFKNCVFHLDKYDSNFMFTFNMANLALLLEDTERAAKLRELIIDKKLPEFMPALPKSILPKCANVLGKLNKVQQRAALKALTAKDYLLIKGMPGTGKTATIASLIHLLVELNKTVLVTSHTNSAVDNVCVRLKELGVEFLRLGANEKMSSQIKSRSEYALTKDCQTPEELEAVYKKAKVVAVTCLGSKHPLLSKRTLDYCVVDESTQVLQTSIFRVLLSCKKFILIGDPEQLPPVVRNTNALEKGLSESLFKRLCNEKNTISLTYNYRMNKTITEVANKFTYGGELLVGNEAVANSTLKLSKPPSDIAKKWIAQILNSDVENSVQIVDTGNVCDLNHNIPWLIDMKLQVAQDEDQKNLTNPYETSVTVTLTKALLKMGVPEDSIGVLSPYRAQVAQLSFFLQKLNIEVNTVDQFQGRDKDVMIYSATKSKKCGMNEVASRILDDKRRLTVALTRAKVKFILVTDCDTIIGFNPFKRLFDIVESRNFLRLEDGNLDFDWNEVLSLNCINL